MPPNTGKRLGRLGLNTRILILVGLPMAMTAAITSVVVYRSTRHFVADAIGDQMVMQARIVAHLVAMAEESSAQSDPAAVNRRLKEIARFAKQQKNYYYEFWITDSAGKVYMGTEG